MSERRLPLQLDPYRFAEWRQSISGTLQLKDMTRLRDVLLLNEIEKDVANVKLEGGVDQQGYLYLKGYIEAEVKLRCQRCLEPMNYVIKTQLVLSPVKEDNAIDCLPSCYEALLVSDRFINLSDIIEDEILLAIPNIPKHEDCSGKKENLGWNDQKIKLESENSLNPFSKLKDLKKQLHEE